MISRIYRFILLILLLLSAACSGRRLERSVDWQPNDLRLLEAPGRPDPTSDLIAAYIRQTCTDLEIRVDLLGSPNPYAFDIYIALDTLPGGGGRLPLDLPARLDWDILLRYPAVGLPSAVSSNGRPLAELRPRILRDAALDALTARLSRKSLSFQADTLAFQVFLVPRGQSDLADSIGPARLAGPAVTARASAYLAFWDSLPAATPAQALRRWDGAHTGPFGQRHGLAVLLRAASSSGVPVILLDLARSDRLSALDALGGLKMVRRMVRENLLSIAACGTQTDSAEAALKRFRIPLGKLAFSDVSASPTGCQGAFARLEDTAHLVQWNDLRLVPLPAESSTAGEDLITTGLPVETRRALLAAALSPDPADLVALGGSLPTSPWGDLEVASLSFQYLAGHPWIQVLSAGDLLQFPAIPGQPACETLLCAPHPPSAGDAPGRQPVFRQELFPALAALTRQKLLAPQADPRLAELQSGYIGVITGPLQEAALWEKDPQPEAGCPADIDMDGMPECILASRDVFAVIDPQGARLTLLAMRKSSRAFQVVGPRAQFALALGPPAEWTSNPGRGDPQDIPGAFTNPSAPWILHQVDVSPQQIAFTLPETGARITYRLVDHGLSVNIQPGGPLSTSIPLALITSDTYAPGGYSRYRSLPSADPATFLWSLRGGPTVEVDVEGADLSSTTFAGSLPLLPVPEDPNITYPPGFTLPFPLALIELRAPGEMTLTITGR